MRTNQFCYGSQDLYYLNIHAAYVGAAPEKELAEYLHISRIMLYTEVCIEFEPAGENTFDLDFNEIHDYIAKAFASEFEADPESLAFQFMLSNDESVSKKPLFIVYQNTQFVVNLIVGELGDRMHYAHGQATDTWSSVDGHVTGSLHESYSVPRGSGVYDNPSIKFVFRRVGGDKYDSPVIFEEKQKLSITALADKLVKAIPVA